MSTHMLTEQNHRLAKKVLELQGQLNEAKAAAELLAGVNKGQARVIGELTSASGVLAFRRLDEPAKTLGWILIHDPEGPKSLEFVKASWANGPHGYEEWVCWDGPICPGPHAVYCVLPIGSSGGD